MNPNDPQQTTVAAPSTSQPYTGGYGTPVVSPQPAQPALMPSRIGRGKHKLWIGLAAVLLVAGGACGYAFGFYLPSTPSSVYSSSLRNSGKALDQLVQYSRSQSSVNYKSATLNHPHFRPALAGRSLFLS